MNNIYEDNLSELNNLERINIICGKSGYGKTSLLNSLQINNKLIKYYDEYVTSFSGDIPKWFNEMMVELKTELNIETKFNEYEKTNTWDTYWTLVNTNPRLKINKTFSDYDLPVSYRKLYKTLNFIQNNEICLIDDFGDGMTEEHIKTAIKHITTDKLLKDNQLIISTRYNFIIDEFQKKEKINLIELKLNNDFLCII